MKPLQVPLTTPPISVDRDPRVTDEMREAADGIEAMFTGEMLKAMRKTVETSEYSLQNSASEIYQSLLDQEYAQIAANKNALGLSEQIIEYWLRSMPEPQYNGERTSPISPSTGGTNEGQSGE